MKQFIKTNLVPLTRGISISDLRALAQREPEAFVAKLQKGADEGKFKLEDMRDLRNLYLGLADVPVPVLADFNGIQRAVMTSAFPVLTSIAAVAQINQAYDAVETVGQELVTEFDDAKKITVVAQVNTLDSQKDEVGEREDFPEVGTSEENVEIRHKKNGRKITYSAESILENDLQDIVRRTNKLGEIANEWIEEQTIDRVMDYHGSAAGPAEPYVYRPNGIGTQLYSSVADEPGTRAPAGTELTDNPFDDEVALENARIRLGTMLNERDRRMAIPHSQVQLFVPDAIVGRVLKTLASEYVPGVENEYSNWGPKGKWNIPANRVLSSPKLDDRSASAWLYGAIKKQFMRKWKMRMEVITMGMNTQAYLDSQIAFQARIAWDVEIGANDYVYVLRNLSETTKPIDE